MRTEIVGGAAVEEFAFAEGGELKTLIELGRRLDRRVAGGSNVRELLARTLLNIRDKNGLVRQLELNAAQRKFEAECGPKNIILKARQLGMTTWVAARFLINTITRPGTLSVQVAHDQESAEQIFKIVRRMVENLPPSVQQAVRVSRANVRQIVFAGLDSEFRVETAADANAGRGLTIQNLHGSEVSRWPGNAEETLASLRAAVVPGGEITLESTANGAWGQSQLSITANNYFGLKAHGEHPVMEFRTCEFGEKGKSVVVAKFAVYTSIDECFECRDRQITNGSAYEGARQAKSDPEKFVREMAKHWATDPKYSEKLLRIYRENGFDKWDE